MNYILYHYYIPNQSEN